MAGHTAAGTAAGTAPATRATGTVGRARVITALRVLAVVVVAAFAVYYLHQHWDEFWETIAGIAWQSSALSLLALCVAIGVTTYGWHVMVNAFGPAIGYRTGAQIFLVGQLGKYVPGSVWLYLLQMELGRQAGLSRARVFVATLVHMGIGLVIAMLVGVIALPVIFDTSPNARWVLVLLPIGLIAMHPRILSWAVSLMLRILRRREHARRLRMATIGKVVTASSIAKLLQGLHLWLLANAVGTPGWLGLLLCIGAMSLGMAAGTAAPIFPAGVGAREGVIVAVLVVSGISAPQAAAFAAASRVMFIVADLITAATAVVAARGSRQRARLIPR
ncbi:lysylphosphatidylglycerol synthase domain-containing protein [Haloechinothrix sp. LS1_15]|uniref:lysylphosphatidylglycerol synthase domain-containing protein n=1 Tax=Haloechinothrix sp. LS1_15 TaxID=2652248 RepID=UPI0029457FB0|nr:lysylphosphatidylglycerol synthase domain-containing protein [Haloechinothrix sp. LS1_15]MDV6012368.1 UPF0104 family protein [Haloechinothrix sp. LS1_15]